MLHISSQQRDSFSGGMRKKFEKRMAQFLRKEFPDAREVKKEDLANFVHQQTSKSFQYGLKFETQTAEYIATAWLMGGDFDTKFPVVEKTMQAKKIEPEEKKKWLIAWRKKVFQSLQRGKK
jgi:hypothetical protein